MSWKVKKSGAMLETVIGVDELDSGVKRPIIRVITGIQGQTINADLSPQFEERWDNGEEHARSLVDKLDSKGNVITDKNTEDTGSGLQDVDNDELELPDGDVDPDDYNKDQLLQLANQANADVSDNDTKAEIASAINQAKEG